MSVRYLVVDDEQLARKLIIAHASKIEGLVFVDECSSAIATIKILERTSVDLIFLDIEMPELDGLQFVRTMKNPPAIVMTTAHRQFAADAFDLDVVDYLVKPISFERFLKSYNKLVQYLRINEPAEKSAEAPAGVLYVKSDRKIFPVDMTDIMYIESLDNYVKIHLKSRFIITRESISHLEAKLPANDFVRIHRSFIVSRKNIEAISAEAVRVVGKDLPVGRAFRQVALGQLKGV
jgi:DNA-binding LytR/AlgR family response regulator